MGDSFDQPAEEKKTTDNESIASSENPVFNPNLAVTQVPPNDTIHSIHHGIAQFVSQHISSACRLRSGEFNVSMSGYEVEIEGRMQPRLLIAVSGEMVDKIARGRQNTEGEAALKNLMNDSRWRKRCETQYLPVGQISLANAVGNTAKIKYGYGTPREYPQVLEWSETDTEKRKKEEIKGGQNSFLIDRSALKENKVMLYCMDMQLREWKEVKLDEPAHQELLRLVNRPFHLQTQREQKRIYDFLIEKKIMSQGGDYKCSEPKLAAEREKMILLYSKFRDTGESHFKIAKSKGYNLVLMSENLKENTIEFCYQKGIQKEEAGFKYRVIGLDRQEKAGFIKRDKLSPNFPDNNQTILSNQAKLLPKILQIISESNEDHVPKTVGEYTATPKSSCFECQKRFKRLRAGEKKDLELKPPSSPPGLQGLMSEENKHDDYKTHVNTALKILEGKSISDLTDSELEAGACDWVKAKRLNYEFEKEYQNSPTELQGKKNKAYFIRLSVKWYEMQGEEYLNLGLYEQAKLCYSAALQEGEKLSFADWPQQKEKIQEYEKAIFKAHLFEIKKIIRKVDKDKINKKKLPTAQPQKNMFAENCHTIIRSYPWIWKALDSDERRILHKIFIEAGDHFYKHDQFEEAEKYYNAGLTEGGFPLKNDKECNSRIAQCYLWFAASVSNLKKSTLDEEDIQAANCCIRASFCNPSVYQTLMPRRNGEEICEKLIILLTKIVTGDISASKGIGGKISYIAGISRLYATLGEHYEKRGEKDLAILNYTKAIEDLEKLKLHLPTDQQQLIDKQFGYFYIRRALLRLEYNKKRRQLSVEDPRAAQDYKKAIEMYPNVLLLLNNTEKVSIKLLELDILASPKEKRATSQKLIKGDLEAPKEEKKADPKPPEKTLSALRDKLKLEAGIASKAGPENTWWAGKQFEVVDYVVTLPLSTNNPSLALEWAETRLAIINEARSISNNTAIEDSIRKKIRLVDETYLLLFDLSFSQQEANAVQQLNLINQLEEALSSREINFDEKKGIEQDMRFIITEIFKSFLTQEEGSLEESDRKILLSIFRRHEKMLKIELIEYLNQGRYQEAEKILLKIQKIGHKKILPDPSSQQKIEYKETFPNPSSEWYCLLGRTYYGLGKYEKSRDNYETAFNDIKETKETLNIANYTDWLIYKMEMLISQYKLSSDQNEKQRIHKELTPLFYNFKKHEGSNPQLEKKLLEISSLLSITPLGKSDSKTNTSLINTNRLSNNVTDSLSVEILLQKLDSSIKRFSNPKENKQLLKEEVILLIDALLLKISSSKPRRKEQKELRKLYNNLNELLLKEGDFKLLFELYYKIKPTPTFSYFVSQSDELFHSFKLLPAEIVFPATFNLEDKKTDTHAENNSQDSAFATSTSYRAAKSNAVDEWRFFEEEATHIMTESVRCQGKVNNERVAILFESLEHFAVQNPNQAYKVNGLRDTLLNFLSEHTDYQTSQTSNDQKDFSENEDVPSDGNCFFWAAARQLIHLLKNSQEDTWPSLILLEYLIKEDKNLPGELKNKSIKEIISDEKLNTPCYHYRQRVLITSLEDILQKALRKSISTPLKKFQVTPLISTISVDNISFIRGVLESAVQRDTPCILEQKESDYIQIVHLRNIQLFLEQIQTDIIGPTSTGFQQKNAFDTKKEDKKQDNEDKAERDKKLEAREAKVQKETNHQIKVRIENNKDFRTKWNDALSSFGFLLAADRSHVGEEASLLLSYFLPGIAIQLSVQNSEKGIPATPIYILDRTRKEGDAIGPNTPTIHLIRLPYAHYNSAGLLLKNTLSLGNKGAAQETQATNLPLKHDEGKSVALPASEVTPQPLLSDVRAIEPKAKRNPSLFGKLNVHAEKNNPRCKELLSQANGFIYAIKSSTRAHQARQELSRIDPNNVNELQKFVNKLRSPSLTQQQARRKT